MFDSETVSEEGVDNLKLCCIFLRHVDEILFYMSLVKLGSKFIMITTQVLKLLGSWHLIYTGFIQKKNTPESKSLVRPLLHPAR